MANELKSQVATRQGVPLGEAMLKDATNAPLFSLDFEVKPAMPVGLFQNTNNGIQLPVAIGASQRSDNSYGLNVSAVQRDEGIIKIYSFTDSSIGATQDVNYHTVPARKIWRFLGWQRVSTGGTFTTGIVSILAPDNTEFVLSVSATRDVYTLLTLPIQLEEGWRIKFLDYYSVILTARTNALLVREIDP